MKFIGPHHQEMYEKIHTFLRELLGGRFMKLEDNPVFVIPRGSTYIHLFVTPINEDEDEKIVLQFITPLVKDIELTKEVLHFLLRYNHSNSLGSFGLDKDEWITLNHTLIAETCSQEELGIIVATISSTADDMDDLIIQKWGGSRAIQTGEE